MNFEQTYRLLLEKDHRKTIEKFGFPKDVADYLHNFNDKYSLWFADQFKRMQEYQDASNKLMFVRLKQTQMRGILDWVVNTPNTLLKQYNWNTALIAADDYHTNLSVSDLDAETNTILYKYPDGFYWVDLESQRDTCEASAMGHCATTHDGDTLYSLRKYNKATDSLEPFITLSISPSENTWHQCKGKKNSKPKEEYWEYIADILIRTETFTYKAEYDSKADFGPKEFISYLEDNEDKIPNAQEYIEKINESSISIKDFQKILDAYKFEYYDIYLNDDQEDELFVSTSFSFLIKDEDTEYDISELDLENDEARKYVEKYFDVDHMLEVGARGGASENANDIFIRETESEMESYSMDKMGLKQFDRYVDELSVKDKAIDYDDFMENHLEKVLVLDGCIHSDLHNFKLELDEMDNIKTKYESDLDLTVTVGSFPLRTDYIAPISKLRSLDFTVTSSLSALMKQEGYSSKKHMDIAAYYVFWNFIRNNVWGVSLPEMKITYNSNSYDRRFEVKFLYDYNEEDIDYEKRLKQFEKISDSTQKVIDVYNKFNKEIIVGLTKNGKHIKPEDIKFKYSNHSSPNDKYYTKEELEQAPFDDDATSLRGFVNGDDVAYFSVREMRDALETVDGENKLNADKFVKYIIDKVGIKEFNPIPIDEIYDWMENHIDHQKTFKGFYESYMFKKVVYK